MRITQIYEHASLIGLNSTDFERRLAERGDLAEEDVDQANVDEAVKRAYGLQTKGVSYASANDAERLAPSEGYKYSAILFIPKISAAAGAYQSNPLTYHYPCVNAAGFLDGIFLVMQSDKAEDIPD